MINRDFLKNVLADKKKLMPLKEVKHVQVPKFDELSVVNLQNATMVKINLQVLLSIGGSLFWVTGCWCAGARFRGQLVGFVLHGGGRQVASQDLNLIVGQKWLQLAKWSWHGQGGMQTHAVCAVLPSRDALSHVNKIKAAWMEPVYHGF